MVNETESICRPLDILIKYDVLYQNSNHEDFRFSLEYLHISSHISLIYEWLDKQYGKESWATKSPLDDIINVHSNILTSPDSQAFMCTINDVPCCNVNLFRNLEEPNDFTMQVLAKGGSREDQLAIKITIHFVLLYIFSFEEVDRIVISLGKSDLVMIALMKAAGFDTEIIRRSKKDENVIYYCDRQMVLNQF